MPDGRHCEITDMDCSPKCPGCIMRDGGIWNPASRRWTYPSDTSNRWTAENRERRARNRVLRDCDTYGCPTTGALACVLCGRPMDQFSVDERNRRAAIAAHPPFAT